MAMLWAVLFWAVCVGGLIKLIYGLYQRFSTVRIGFDLLGLLALMPTIYILHFLSVTFAPLTWTQSSMYIVVYGAFSAGLIPLGVLFMLFLSGRVVLRFFDGIFT